MYENPDILTPPPFFMVENERCPICNSELIGYTDKYGDKQFFCAGCHEKLSRYGFNGPLCVNELGR